MSEILDSTNNVVSPDNNNFNFINLLYLIIIIMIVCGIIQYCSAG